MEEEYFTEKKVECVECGNMFRIMTFSSDDGDHVCNKCNFADIGTDTN